MTSTCDITGVILSENLASENPFSWKFSFFQQKTQMDGVEPFLSGGLTILFDFFAEFYISTSQIKQNVRPRSLLILFLEVASAALGFRAIYDSNPRRYIRYVS